VLFLNLGRNNEEVATTASSTDSLNDDPAMRNNEKLRHDGA
jgi:hypothetical protein